MVLAVGETLQDRYRIDAELEQGGMAAVYRAWDTRLNLPVAVKRMIPQPRLTSDSLDQLRVQFKQEAQTLARLDHPSLVRVTDSFSQLSSEYLVMNFVDGESLGDRVERLGPLPEAQVLEWAGQLLGALAYCHKQGIIHRDVKSHNVIIRPDGRAVLIDFGLVKLWDPDDPQTKTVMRGMGTPAFAPPEQFEGDAEYTDELSDIYGLGATLYHALSGTFPATAAMRSANPEKYAPLRSLAPMVSRETAAVVEKAIALARSERWQSVEEMMEALEAAKRANRGRLTVPLWGNLSGGETSEEQAAGGVPRKRLPVWAGAMGLLAVLLGTAGLAMGLGWIGGGSKPTPSPEGTTPVSAAVAATETSTATPRPTSTPSPTPTLADTPSPTPSHTTTPSPTATHSPTVTATATPTPTPVVHVLAEGENPWIVAQIYGVTVEALLEANDITDPNKLQIGERLIIPREESAQGTPTFTPTPAPTPKLIIHILQEGENLWTVAQIYGVSVESLLDINDISDPGTLQIGQELIIPRERETLVDSTPVLTPTVALSLVYEEPKLIRPLFNSVFGFDQHQVIQLLWTPTSLAQDHWYEVQLRQAENAAPMARYWTRENWWDMGVGQYRPGDYYWRVVIVRGRGKDALGAVSPPSQTWYFQWVPVAPPSKATPTLKPTATLSPTPAPTPTNTPRPTATPTATPRPTSSP